MTSNSIDFSKVEKVLVANLRHHGDVLLSSPVFSILKKRFPHLNIDAYIYAETFTMLKNHPAISRFYLYDKEIKKKSLFKRWLYELKILLKLRKNSYDMVINLTEGDRGAIVARISNPLYAIGVDPEGTGMIGKKSIYTHLIKKTQDIKHTVERHLDALRCIGIHPDEKEKKITFNVPQQDMQRVDHLVQGNFVLIHSVSRWMFKALPSHTIAEVVKYLINQKIQVVLTASSMPSEVSYVKEVIKICPDVVDLSGKTTLIELGALIKKCMFIVSVDSVPMHIASALKKPTLGIFGPSCDVKWGPYKNPRSKVISLNIPCRPCFQKGCGGSGLSKCLEKLQAEKIIKPLSEMVKESELAKPF